MANAVSSVDVPLSLFSGWNTELSPPDQPEGASPANNDVVFTPGAVATRPGVNRIFSAPVSSLGPFSYEKSFVMQNGNIKNLYLTKGDGLLWVEDVTNSPGTATVLYTSAGATYASSCTAQFREYIALSDGVHGADVPLSYDGTKLRRVTQDGPGVAPVVTSVALASSTMVASGSAPTAAITQIQPAQLVTVGAPPNFFQYYISFVVTIPSTAGIAVDTAVTVSGNGVSAFNATWNVIQIVSATGLMCSCYLPSSTTTGTGGTLTIGSNTTLTRANNTVSCTTATAHNLQLGYQAQIQGAGTTVVGGTISSIVLNNEDTPGLATVTMNAAHGLLPQNQVNIQGVTGATAGVGIINVAFAGNFVTINTSAPHLLSIGSEVIIAAVTNTTVNGEWTVAAVPSATSFTYAFGSVITAYSAADTGTVTYLWPLANVDPAQNFFTVQTAPSATTFTIQLSYTDGTWSGGTVSFQWDGIFFVTAILSTTSFQYQQYGPNTTTTTVGTVTPYGQAAPGLHQCQVSFLLDNGDITPPSPPVTFVANGGQYLSITQIPVGFSPVVGRILQFTGAGGAYFYYIPTPAQVNGLVVSTATQINDNTSTSILLDFSDNTLYSATSTSKPGNNLSAQRVLGPTAGFFSYASRLITWGDRNKIENLLNMGFDGGYVIGANAVPSGWTYTPGNGSGALVGIGAVDGGAWEITSDGSTSNKCGILSQSAYIDTNGAPILLGATQYSFRLKVIYGGSVTGSNGSVVAILTSASAGLLATATITLPTPSVVQSYLRFFEVDFSAITPDAIPADTVLEIYGVGNTTANPLILDELELIYTTEPYIDNEAKISYVSNFGGFDENTGNIGAEDDLSPVRNFGVIRQALYIVTGTGLHETADNGQTEPSGWNVDQVADNCGAFSIAAVGRNAQGIGSAGKDWMMWSGPDGAQIFTGQKPMKISQEIQSVWDAIPAAAQFQCWVKNYENAKWCFFGIPTGSSMQTLVLDYRNIDGAAIAENPPIHISFTGKMIVSDLTRKWTSWTLPAWCGELMYRNTIAQPQIVLGCETPSGGANAYILNVAQFHDDDFGVIPASYTTYFFVSHEMEQALQVGSHRHIYTLAQAFIAGVGTWTLTPHAASLSNVFPSSPAFPLEVDPGADVPFGINVTTTRCAFTIQAQPTSGTDSYFKLQKLVINMAKDANMPIGQAGSAF